jgi:UDP-4-amino-4,6-dideoxy-N-acetyl-beta-L-altrosamine N-acetyltransferase
MNLTGERVYLRHITEQDTQDIIRWRNNPKVRKNFIYRSLFTEQGHLKWMKDYIETGKAVQFIIALRSCNQSIGSVYLRDIDRVNNKAEFGIFIGEIEYIGKGYGTEALQLILNYGFKELFLNKIFLRVLANNTRAVKSYEKAGFVQEGYFKQEVLIDQVYADVIFMARLRNEIETE